MLLASDISTQLNTAIFAKDLSHRIIYCNEQFANVCGEVSPQACVGKTDNDFIWKKYVHIYKQSDAYVYQGNVLNNIIEPGKLIDKENANFLLNKNPFFNEAGDIIGAVGSFVDITGFSINKMQSDDSRLGSYFSDACFTPNEYRVLKHVLLGRTAHEIGVKLFKSPKTIETYIARIKMKMQCKTRGDIISQAVRSGLYHHLFSDLIATV